MNILYTDIFNKFRGGGCYGYTHLYLMDIAKLHYGVCVPTYTPNNSM